MKSLRYNHSGFSLLEILISITILAFIMIGVYSVTDNSTRTSERTKAQNGELVSLETALMKIDQDFSLLYTPLFHRTPKTGASMANGLNNNGQMNITDRNSNEVKISRSMYEDYRTDDSKLIPKILNPEKSEFIFLTGNNQRKFQDEKQSDYGWIRYYLEKNDTPKYPEANYRLIRQVESQKLYNDTFNWDKIQGYILLDNVESLEFLFWSEAKKEYVDRISEISTPGILRSIKLKIKYKNLQGNSEELERTFRVLWPYFDSIKEAELLKSLRSGSAPMANPGSQKSIPPMGQEEEFD